MQDLALLEQSSEICHLSFAELGTTLHSPTCLAPVAQMLGRLLSLLLVWAQSSLNRRGVAFAPLLLTDPCCAGVRGAECSPDQVAN